MAPAHALTIIHHASAHTPPVTGIVVVTSPTRTVS
jgi:hypothetical protein